MKRRNMYILAFSLVIVMTGYGIAMPVLPFYIESLGGRGVHYGLLIACYGLMQLLFAPIWGSLSDRYGRKPLLLVGMVGLGSAMAIFAVATQLWMLYAAQLISGCLSSAALPAAQAYASDVTSKEDRGEAMGKIGGAMGLGVVLGPGIGGVLAANTLATPFLIAAGFCLLTFLIILVGLPESLDKQRRCSTKIKFIQTRELGHKLFTPIGVGLAVAFVAVFNQAVFSSTFGLYALTQFNYGPEQVGTMFMAMGLMYAISQGLLVGNLTKRLGEEKTIAVGLIGGAIGLILITLSPNFITILLAMSFFVMMTSLLKPSALALVSKRATINQGQAMGITEAYMSMGKIIGPLWGGVLFDVNVYSPFISGALVFFASTVALVTLGKFQLKEEPFHEKNS